MAAPAPAQAPGEVLVVKVKSPIHPVSAELIADAITEADRRSAAALIVELDTAGGLMTSTRDITTAILGARTPVVVYVAPGGRPGRLGRILHPDVRRRRRDGAGHQRRRRPSGRRTGGRTSRA